MSRIAILTAEFAPFHGGIAAYVGGLAAAAQAMGHTVTVIAPDYGQDLAESDRSLFPHRVRRFRAGAYGGRWYARYAVVALRALISDAFDTILAADIAFAEVLAATRPIHRRAYLATVHGSEINKAALTPRGLLFAPFRVFHAPTRILANSTFTRELLLQRFPRLDPERVEVALLGVETRWFDPPTMAPTEIRIRLGVAPARALVACVARITPRKGQLTLVEAVAGLPASERRDLAVVLAGKALDQDADYHAELLRAAERARPAQVLLPGALPEDELRALYAAADLFCLPGAIHRTAVEGFGLVFLEAAAQGLPALAGKVGGVPEVVRDGETGALVDADDPDALGQRLSALINRPEERARLGGTARERARHFTWSTCAERTFGTA